MLHDVRTAWRALFRAPGFTATSILTLGLAAGANAAILSVVYAILLKPLPYRDPDRLVFVWPQQFQSNADLQFTREYGDMFDGVAAIAPGWTMSLTGRDEPARITVGRVSGNIFAVLGVAPELGQTFTEEGARSANHAVIVLSHRLWTTRFAPDRQVVGQTVLLDGVPVRITGVMPPTFDILGLRSDAYTPLAMDERAWHHRMTLSFFVARLRDGLSLDDADTQYRSLVDQLRRATKRPDDFGRTARLVDLRVALIGDIRTTLAVLSAAVALILLIAGANIGTLQLTRSAARGRDLAIRAALGATRRRLLRHLLAESLLVALAAGILGVAVNQLLLSALLAILPPDTPRLQEIATNPLVSGAVIFAALAVGLSVGLLPALGITGVQTAPLLRPATTTEGRGAKRTRASLVTAEVALAVVLTISAGLMLQTLWKLHAVNPGFRADGVLTLHLQPTGARFRTTSVADYYARVLERVRAVSGVRAAGAIQHLPFSGYSWTAPVDVDGDVRQPGRDLPTAESRVVTDDYFTAMQQPVLAGRAIDAADATRPDVVVVNQAFADRFFGSGAAALGRGLRTRGARGAGPSMTIVGVVGNVRHNALTRAAGPEIYTSIGKNTIPAMMLAIRTSGDPQVVMPAVRDSIRSIDRDVPISDIQLMDGRIAASLGRPRLLLFLLACFAAVGLVLAVVGVYGVVAYSVTQRRRELGIRVALGAERTKIISSVLREALAYGCAGLLLGIAMTLVTRRLLQNVVWGVSTTDPLTYAAIAASTLLVIVAASVGPARRAARVDPAEALKGN